MAPTYITDIQTIIDATAAHLGISAEVIKSPIDRTTPVSYARHVAQYLACTMSYKSKRYIAEQFNCKDHSSVLRAVNKIGLLALSDRKTRNDVATIKQTLMKP